MSLQPEEQKGVPAETARIAKAAFPKGNAYLKLRDELSNLYEDQRFADLFSRRGQPAESPGRLAMVTVLQFAENLSDRQAADAVRSRIDWKYLLGLELDDPGFDYSILSEFRSRLVAESAEERLLEQIIILAREHKLLKERGQQRTDSTHIQAAVRQMNRLEKVGETLRATLNELAEVAPAWLRARAPVEWYEQYGVRIESYRLPKTEPEREALAVQIGEDGYQLLGWAYAAEAPQAVQTAQAVEILRQVWIQEYYQEEDQTHWRKPDNLPPSEKMILSPYDPEARRGTKRDTHWSGYKAHYTESCDEEYPHLIVAVQTTPATTADYDVTEAVHQTLEAQNCLPAEHLIDSGYISADQIVDGQETYGVTLMGPPMPDSSWQAKAGKGFDLAHFQIDWEKQMVWCPAHHASCHWGQESDGQGHIRCSAQFSPRDCLACPTALDCTHNPSRGRSLKFRLRQQHEALLWLRQQVQTDQFLQTYRKRAGIEGTLSQAVRRCDLRFARYLGLAKTHLQHVAIAAAINLSRISAWLSETPLAQTRTSRFAALPSPAL